jgi:general stress protein 26
MKDAMNTISNLISKASVSVISSIDADGFPNSKAMLPPRKIEGITHIYFSTNTSSMRVEQYRRNPKACVYFFDKRFFRGVMLRGNMEILQDKVSREMIWREGDEMYYPKGVMDLDYCVLKFTTQDGRYYSNFQSENFKVEKNSMG